MSQSNNETVETMINEQSYKRPLSIVLLSLLLFGNGAYLLVMQILSLRTIFEASTQLGVSGFLFQTAIAFIGVLGVASGVGMWFGQRWAWWLALFYFAYAICRNLNAILLIQSVVDVYGVPAQGLNSYYLKYGLRILFHAFLIYYLCRDTATDYFRTEHIKKWKAILIVFGISILIFAVVTLTG